jgi:ABC-type transporter Mla subunit MlaD
MIESAAGPGADRDVAVPQIDLTPDPSNRPSPLGGATAEIIPFRPRPVVPSGRLDSPTQATPVAEPPDRQRLAAALQSLQAAVADQRDAVARWRRALADLKKTTSDLGSSLVRYRTNLASVSEGVSLLRADADRLQRVADRLPSSD